MASLVNFVTKIRNDVPVRTASFAGNHGPIAWLGLNAMGRAPAAAACSSMKRSFLSSVKNGGCDFYFDVQWHEEGSPALQCPASSSLKLPVLDVGTLHNEDEPVTCGDFEKACIRDTNYYRAVSASVAALCEKGYIPLTLSDSHRTTLAALEGIKAVGHDNVTLWHFSADTRLSTPDGIVKRCIERQLCKGITQMGQRCTTSRARLLRKEAEIKYADCHALYDRGVFTLKDARNQFPVYLSVDLDVLDPAFAPGVDGDPESSGFTVQALCHIIHAMRCPNIIGMDIVGYEPENDIYRKCGGDGITSIAAAKLAKEMCFKAITSSGKTRMEIEEMVKMEKMKGNHPGQYPEK